MEGGKCLLFWTLPSLTQPAAYSISLLYFSKSLPDGSVAARPATVSPGSAIRLRQHSCAVSLAWRMLMPVYLGNWKGKSSLTSGPLSLSFYHHSSSCVLLPLTLDVTLHRSEKRLTKDSMSERRLIQSLTRQHCAQSKAKKCALSSRLGVSCLWRTPAVHRSSRSTVSLPFCMNGCSALVVS